MTRGVGGSCWTVCEISSTATSEAPEQAAMDAMDAMDAMRSEAITTEVNQPHPSSAEAVQF